MNKTQFILKRMPSTVPPPATLNPYLLPHPLPALTLRKESLPITDITSGPLAQQSSPGIAKNSGIALVASAKFNLINHYDCFFEILNNKLYNLVVLLHLFKNFTSNKTQSFELTDLYLNSIIIHIVVKSD